MGSDAELFLEEVFLGTLPSLQLLSWFSIRSIRDLKGTASVPKMRARALVLASMRTAERKRLVSIRIVRKKKRI